MFSIQLVNPCYQMESCDGTGWKLCSHINGPQCEKICLQGYEQRCRAAGTSAQLISTFVICLLESIISKLATSENFTILASLCSWEAGFRMAWSETPMTGFLEMVPKYTILWADQRLRKHETATLSSWHRVLSSTTPVLLRSLGFWPTLARLIII